MKKTLTATLAFLTMLSLAATAHADVIASPMEASVDFLLPWVLVGTVVGITIFLLQMFRKNKK